MAKVVAYYLVLQALFAGVLAVAVVVEHAQGAGKFMRRVVFCCGKGLV